MEKFSFPPIISKPALSIVIPTYGAKGVDLTANCVASLLSAHSSFQHAIEITVVEDSDDRQIFDALDAALKFYPNVGIISQPNGGFAKACNTGIKVSEGELIFLINNDVEFVDGHPALTYMSDAIIAMRAGAMGLRLVYPDNKIQHGGVMYVNQKDGPGYFDHVLRGAKYDNPMACIVRPMLVTGAVLGFRRNLLWTTGYLDENFGFTCEDIDFELRIIESGMDVIYFGYDWAYHKEGGTRGNTMEAKNAFSPELVAKEQASMKHLFDKWQGVNWENFSGR